MSKGNKLTLVDIEQWVDNDEGLYLWWKSTRLPKRQFVRVYREKLTVVIDNIMSGERRSHYFVYG